MTESHSRHYIYWVIAALLVALVPQFMAMPAHLVALTLVPVTWRVVAEVRHWKPLNLILRVMLTAFTVYVMIMTYGSLMGRRAAVSLLAIMLALKLLETFKVRDARVVASLVLFLCATQFLFTQGILMLVYAAACIASALAALAILHRAQAFQSSRVMPRAGRSVLTELGFSARLLLLAAPVALVLFTFFPRWGSPLWGVPEDTLDAKTGLSDSMTPGSIQQLFMDDSPAFRADFTSEIPPRHLLYWRGPVFWHFDGATWTGSYYGREIRATSKPEVSTAPWRYTVQMEPNERRWLFALDYPAIVPDGVKLTMDYQLYSRRSVTELRTYEMLSNPDFIDSPELLNTMRQAALDLPPGYNPRTRQLVDQWLEETPDEATLASRVLAHFNSENFNYTLNPPLLTQHTVDEFLFDTRSGFCEHYASAFTVMMRMAGIPARVVTGYQGGWYNDLGRYVLVRQSDAHAWSEIWLKGSGWVRVDPTAAVAPSRVEQNALDALGGKRHWLDFTWMRSARNGFDLLQRTWNQWVIAFTADRQSRLLKAFGLDALTPAGLVSVMIGLVALIAALLAPYLLRARDARRKDPATRLWLKFRNQLQAAGVETSPSSGPMELARTAGGQLIQVRDEIREVADIYSRMRYDRNSPALNELAEAIDQFRRRHKATAKSA